MKIIILLFLLSSYLLPQEQLSNYASHSTEKRSIIFVTDKDQKLKLTPYGNNIMRVQGVKANEEFFDDNRYEMVESHNWAGRLNVTEQNEEIILSTGPNGIKIILSKNPLKLLFNKNDYNLLKDKNGICWDGEKVFVSFISDSLEHFAGLGHDYFGRVNKLDLRGQVINRNYGSRHYQQAPLLVPFYLSSKGYGLFLNSTFPNTFSFNKDGNYEIGILGGQIDYFVIAGPEFEKILDGYTQLTGRPRLPPKAAFGLALSDKGNDHKSSDPSDEKWWKRKIKEHRKAGFALDHIVNDNRWRAGGGQRCLSRFEWDSTRYPNPSEYKRWLDSNGLFITLDFNRCIGSKSEGWNSDYNIPNTDSIDFGDSAPDLTRKEVRDWWWGLFWKKSLNPELNFPGDALWIDEFDEMGNSPLPMVLGNGRTWGEMKNYWFFLVAQALVRDGWDKSFDGSRRPFVWVRGMTAGGQRYATLWSGDIVPTYEEMKMQVRGMQAAGLSGFPFWGHDAGGFYNYDLNDGPDDKMYCQWSMAFGAFTPYWKPHGPGRSRWPLDRPSVVQSNAKKYSILRYELMPYLYTYAHLASSTGIPMARAMIIHYQNDPLAWKHDLQYMWGKEILVAPNCSENNNVSVWLPEGKWYDFYNDSLFIGNQTINYFADIGVLPMFIKAGSIIPMTNFALSTAFIHENKITLHIYSGNDASFTLYEDDGKTEAYKKSESRTTAINFNQSKTELIINPSKGTYKDAPDKREFNIIFHGLKNPKYYLVNGRDETGKIILDNNNKTQKLTAGTFSVNEKIVIRISY